MLHIDGDMIAYRIACAVGDEGEAHTVPWTCDSFMTKAILIHFPELTPFHVYLSGDTNFRDDIAVTAPYKGQAARTGPKPKHLPLMRQHLIEKWDAVIYEGIEADDAIATAVMDSVIGQATIVSLDKDFDQLAVPRFNFVTRETSCPTPMQALKNLYKQILTGDSCDNIIGVEGCGPGMAGELIDGCTKTLDMELICWDQLGLDRFLENGNLVYLRRSEKDYFTYSGAFAKFVCEAARKLNSTKEI